MEPRVGRRFPQVGAAEGSPHTPWPSSPEGTERDPPPSKHPFPRPPDGPPFRKSPPGPRPLPRNASSPRKWTDDLLSLPPPRELPQTLEGLVRLTTRGGGTRDHRPDASTRTRWSHTLMLIVFARLTGANKAAVL